LRIDEAVSLRPEHNQYGCTRAELQVSSAIFRDTYLKADGYL